MARIKYTSEDRDIPAIRSPLSGYAKAMLAALVGVALGLMATDLTTSHGLLFGGARSGAWTTWPRAGAANPDPYTRAVLARRGEAPLGNGEGIGFFAERDSEGRLLDGGCDYILSSALPAARYWTLALLTPTGGLLIPGDDRQSLTSSNLLRRSDGSFAVIVSATARSGNWLASRPGAFLLALYLYDSNLNDSNLVSQAALEGLPMPEIRRESCAG